MTVLGGSGYVSASAGDIIRAALRLIGQLAEGEQPSSQTMSDSLFALRLMMDSWNTESLSIYTTQTQVFTWPAGEGTRTLGPSGDFNGIRPTMMSDSTYFVDPGSGVSYQLSFINESTYNQISLKSATSSFPQQMWVEMTNPDLALNVFPVPTRDLQFNIVGAIQFDIPVGPEADLLFPPGYLRAFKYNLAIELAPEFGVEASRSVRRIADISKRNIKRVNSAQDLLSMPVALVFAMSRFNIYAGDQ